MQGSEVTPTTPTTTNITDCITKFQAKHIKALKVEIPLTPFGSLTGFWNPELVINAPDGEDLPDEAWEELDYSEGYPTIVRTGLPFWDRIAGEPVKFYDCFHAYLQLGPTRDLQQLYNGLTNGDSTPLALLKSLYDLYYWEPRAAEYDKALQIARERRRVVDACDTEDKHYAIAESLVERCVEALSEPERFKLLSERSLIELLKMGITLQRISVGLSAGGGGSREQSTVIVNQNTIQQQNGSSELALAKALANPETADLAQRLAIKMQGTPIDITPDSGEGVAEEISETGSVR